VPCYDLMLVRREPHVERIEPEPAAYAGQERVIKSLDEEFPLGQHAHAVERAKLTTESDGAHEHAFVLPDGTEVWTTFDGGHRHALTATDASGIPSEPACGGMHWHAVELPGRLIEAFGVDRIVTSEDGTHGHALGACETMQDGLHGHKLKLPSGEVIESLTPAAAWRMLHAGAVEQVEQQARAASAATREQAAKAKRDDQVTAGEFFFMPKPTRPTLPEELMTVDRAVAMVDERKETWLPAYVQKKYDGVRHQIHKDGDSVVIYSEDGDDNTDRLPGVVEAVRALDASRLVLDCEVERWRAGQHLPRETVAGYLSELGEPDDSELVANVFDVLWMPDFENGDLHKQPLSVRIEYLGKLGVRQSTMVAPNPRQRLNVAPSVLVATPAEFREQLERIRKLVGSEGIVSKQAKSPYPLDVVTPDTWLKYHNATTLRGVVVAKKQTRAGAWVYTYGVRPGETKAETVTVDGRAIAVVGDSFSTAREYAAGDGILIEAETVNLMESEDGAQLTAWVPRVIGAYEGEPDTIDSAAARAKDNLVLQRKRVTTEGVQYLEGAVSKASARVPTAGRAGAEVMFIGASPSAVEAAREEPFVGPDGETLRELYLKPLGLERGDVALGNAVPELLESEDGKAREPQVEELKRWRDWLRDDIHRINPYVVVALGRTAEGAIAEALGVPPDFVLPHPAAVRRRGDTGEVARKVRQILRALQERRGSKARLLDRMKKLEKQPPPPLMDEGEEETRGERAFQAWEKNWHQALPASGKGRFVYQHHWRGLSEDEAARLDDKALMETAHSVHGDIRLEGEDGALWGWAVLLGSAEDNRRLPHQDKLIDIATVRKTKPGDKIELAPKLPQPSEWLDVGKDKPMVVGPGEVGATSQKFSKFFAIDSGTYELGVARQHAVEIFLDGKLLRGRYLLQFAPVAATRRWLIDKPEDETPMAERRDVAEVLAELRTKRQPYLVWGKPGSPPQKYSVSSGRVVKSARVPLLKGRSLEAKRIVYGVVLDPYVVDAHNDWIPAEHVEETAHDWFRKSRRVTLHHKTFADAEAVESSLVEYPTGEDYAAARQNLPHSVYRRKFGTDVVHSGSWLLGVKLSQELWEAYKRGEIAAFSIEGYGMRTDATVKAMPQVKFIDFVEVARR
jgi:uracil-DNA glycosylase